jgi:hypothetical protein
MVSYSLGMMAILIAGWLIDGGATISPDPGALRLDPARPRTGHPRHHAAVSYLAHRLLGRGAPAGVRVCGDPAPVGRFFLLVNSLASYA